MSKPSRKIFHIDSININYSNVWPQVVSVRSIYLVHWNQASFMQLNLLTNSKSLQMIKNNSFWMKNKSISLQIILFWLKCINSSKPKIFTSSSWTIALVVNYFIFFVQLKEWLKNKQGHILLKYFWESTIYIKKELCIEIWNQKTSWSTKLGI